MSSPRRAGVRVPRAAWLSFVVCLLLLGRGPAVLAEPGPAGEAPGLPVTFRLVHPGDSCQAAPQLSRTALGQRACGPIASIDTDVVATTPDGEVVTLRTSHPLRGQVTLVPYTHVQVDALRLGVGAGLTRAHLTLRARQVATDVVVELGRASMERLTTPLDPEAALEFEMPLAGGLDGMEITDLELSISLEGATALNWFVAADGRTSTTVWSSPSSAPSAPQVSCNGVQATIVGTEGGDELVGTDGPDVIVGLGGDDHIDGRGGDDIICGGAGHDVVLGGAGADVILGEVGDDRLDGGDGPDRIDGGNGLDLVLGSGGADQLYGGSNDDWVDGGDGDDRLFGEQGSDDLFGGPGADYLKGGRDGDQLVGGPGADRLIGDGSADILRGDAGDDRLDAGEGDDRLEGGAGDDDLDGGEGDDTGDGGDDHDACRAIEVQVGCETS